MSNWPSTAVTAIALAGRPDWDLDDALTVAFAGRTLTTTSVLAASVGVDADGRRIYTGLPAGTKVIVVSASDAGRGGMRVLARTADGGHSVCARWGAFTGWLTLAENIRWTNRRVALSPR